MREEQIKRRIFEKVEKRINELRRELQPFCPELNPDVIVFLGDQTMLFEPQNAKVIEWLHREFAMENLGVREQIHIHPVRCQTISEALRAAGFEVNGWDTNRKLTEE